MNERRSFIPPCAKLGLVHSSPWVLRSMTASQHEAPQLPWASLAPVRGTHSISGSVSPSLCASDRRHRSWPVPPPLLCLPLIGVPAGQLHPGLQLLSDLVRQTCLPALLRFLWPWLNSGQRAGGDLRTLLERAPLPRTEARGGGVADWSMVLLQPLLGTALESSEAQASIPSVSHEAAHGSSQ